MVVEPHSEIVYKFDSIRQFTQQQVPSTYNYIQRIQQISNSVYESTSTVDNNVEFYIANKPLLFLQDIFPSYSIRSGNCIFIIKNLFLIVVKHIGISDGRNIGLHTHARIHIIFHHDAFYELNLLEKQYTFDEIYNRDYTNNDLRFVRFLRNYLTEVLKFESVKYKNINNLIKQFYSVEIPLNHLADFLQGLIDRYIIIAEDFYPTFQFKRCCDDDKE